jgi:hypothetical protein
MLAGNDPPVVEMLALPSADPVEDVVGQTEAAEEA